MGSGGNLGLSYPAWENTVPCPLARLWSARAHLGTSGEPLQRSGSRRRVSSTLSESSGSQSPPLRFSGSSPSLRPTSPAPISADSEHSSADSARFSAYSEWSSAHLVCPSDVGTELGPSRR